MSNPFEKLKGMREQLPPGPSPVEKRVVEPAPFRGKVVVRFERKGRAGKTVTVVAGVQLTGEPLESLARELKKALGCGATVEEGNIVLQGDQVDRAFAWLEAKGARKVVRGT